MTNAQLIKHLHDLLKPVQKQMFESFFKASGRKYVIHSSRRLGKTYLLCVLSSIVAASKSNAQIRYASVTQKAVRKMVHPIFREIFKDVPTSKRPKYNSLEGSYKFPNGSEIHCAGVNNGHADDLRGTAADLAVVDESGFIDDLSYLIDSVLMPQLLTTGGKLVMASSSPLSPAHEFTSYIHEARQSQNYSSYNIHQGGYAPEVVEEFCLEAGGAKSTNWRREYLNEIIVDSNYAIVPEWKKEFEGKYIESESGRFYHRYASMDIGTRDFTALIFAVYDFRQARLYILGESIISGPEVTTFNIAKRVMENEKALGIVDPYKRVSDNNNLILLSDLSSMHDIHFSATNKDTLEAMVNEMRLWVAAGRVVVDPTCVQTLGCLEFGVWNKDRKDWGRSQNFGHFDALAALMYLIRNIDQHTNPIPVDFGTTLLTHYTPPDESGEHDNILKMLNL